MSSKNSVKISALSATVAVGVLIVSGSAQAEPGALFDLFASPRTAQGVTAYAAYEPQRFSPPSSATTVERDDDASESVSPPASRFRRQTVDYPTTQPAGTIIVDTQNTHLYYVLGNGKAIRYGIGVGRQGFTWSGTEQVSRKAEWPDWVPPPEMLKRQPYLPRFMAGGPHNPLGARAIYLGSSVYRIHGTNAPSTIGGRVSSGCIRMTNADVTDLYARVRLGATVVVLPASGPSTAGRASPRARAAPSS